MNTGLTGKARILLVEDHEDTLNVMYRLLRTEYDVDKAKCVKDASEKMASSSYDLVIADIGLPDGCGKAMIREFKAKYGVKAIAVTGYAYAEDIKSCKAAGFEAVLTKPVTLYVLLANIISVLGGTRASIAETQLRQRVRPVLGRAETQRCGT